MIKLADLPKRILTARSGLWSRVDYQVDPDDPGHVEKKLHAPGNYNCVGESAEDFVNAVLENARQYRAAREGKVGKRTQILFHELIYSGPEGRLLNAEEKKTVELAYIASLNGAPARVAWHDDVNAGRSDMHILFAYHIDGAPTISQHYGNGKESFSYALYRTEKELIEELNRLNPGAAKILTTAEVAAVRRSEPKQEKQTAADMFVTLLGDEWDGSQNDLRRAIEQRKVKVTRENDEFISVILPGRKRASRFYFHELAQGKERAKMREQEKAKAAARKKRQLGRDAADDL